MILRAAESRLLAFMGGRQRVAAKPMPTGGFGQDAFVKAAEPVGGGAPILRAGMRGDAVKFLQAALQNKGFNPGPLDGVFGAKTDAALRAFQASAGIAVDGVAGPQTWGAMSGAAAPAPAPTGAPRAADAGHVIGLDTAQGQYIKDPSFANNGAPIGNQRYIAFGNLRQFYLKGFSAQNGELKFGKGEIPIQIQGIPGNLDGRWAPQVQVVGDRVHLLYCAGEMPPGGINWPSFRLRSASMPLADFVRQAESGQPVNFQDHGAMFQDQTTFGGDPNFAMIDPQYWVNPQGKAYMSYTVVKHGIPGVRPHESFIRYREVDPNHPARAIGPDMAMMDGWSKGPHAGVAEAQDIVTLNGQPYVFMSSRAGDIDQKVMAAPIGANLGRIADGDLKPVLDPGGSPWKSNAVGSTSAVTIDGQSYLLHQGMGADKHFHLGWTKLAV